MCLYILHIGAHPSLFSCLDQSLTLFGSTARVLCRWLPAQPVLMLPSPGPSVYIWKKKNTQIVERPTNYLIKTNKLAKLDQGARINEKNPDRVTPVQLYSRYGDSLFPDMVPVYLSLRATCTPNFSTLCKDVSLLMK